MTLNQINRLSADVMTRVVQTKYGAQFSARSERGRRWIVRKDGCGGLMISISPHRKTWVEAVGAAHEHFGWTARLFGGDVTSIAEHKVTHWNQYDAPGFRRGRVRAACGVVVNEKDVTGDPTCPACLAAANGDGVVLA